MHIGFRGTLTDEPEIRAGFIGCGSHSFRNVYPTFQFAPVRLVATCDLAIEKARAFAEKFGARAAYDDYRRMLEAEEPDAVFVVTGYDPRGRPIYPGITVDCLEAGCHVWIEKPPASSCAEIEQMQDAAAQAGKNVLVAFKKMFFPANEKAKALADAPDFGSVELVTLRYPQYVPTVEEFERYASGERVPHVVSFLDHLCHPVSLMVYLLGMPRSLYYERSPHGAGLATFSYDSGAVASLALTHGSSRDGGMERTTIVSNSGRDIVVDNNVRVSLHRDAPKKGYGSSPDFYLGGPERATAAWEPEFSLGQLYNKGLFLLGYYNEVNEFARSVLERRAPSKGHLDHAWQITAVFEAFARGPRRAIDLPNRRQEACAGRASGAGSRRG